MTLSPNLPNLLARVEKGEGPDRAVELDLHDALLGRLHREPFGPEDGSRIPPYTASLDAALALVGRVLPTHLWSILQAEAGDRRFYRVTLGSHIDDWDSRISGVEGATPALALLAAMLKALIALPTSSGEEHGK